MICRQAVGERNLERCVEWYSPTLSVTHQDSLTFNPPSPIKLHKIIKRQWIYEWHEWLHYSDVTSTSMRLKSLGIWLFVHYFDQDDNTGNIKAPNYWLFMRGNHMGPIYSTHIRPAMRKAFPCHHIFLITHLLVAQLVKLRMMDLLDWELIKSYIIYNLQKMINDACIVAPILQQRHYQRTTSCCITLTHWGRDKMAATFQTTFSSAFSWMKMFEFRLKFHLSLFLRVQFTIFQHWFR